MQEHNIALNFASSPVTISNHTNVIKQIPEVILEEIQPMLLDAARHLRSKLLDAARHLRSKLCVIAVIEDPANDVIDDCAISDFQSTTLEMPEHTPGLKSILAQYKQLFVRKPGKAEGTYHYIPTSGSPVKIPPRRIPAHYKEEVENQIENQIQSMLANHTIEESSSPWMSPAVFVKKKTGDINLCINYRELNKKTTRDAYPARLFS